MARQKLRLCAVKESCGWCGNFFELEKPISGLQARSLFDLLPKGEWVQIKTDYPKKLIGFIPAEDSKASKEGWDICFTVCSENCLHRVEDYLGKIDWIEQIESYQ